MTCIVGLKASSTKTIMGCDLLATSGWTAYEIEHKIIKRGDDLLIGVSGEERLFTILKHIPDEDFPAPPSLSRGYRHYAETKLVETIRAACRNAGYLQKENDVETLPDCEILIGLPGQLFYITSNLGVNTIARNFMAIGSGAREAMGSLDTSEQVNTGYRTLRGEKQRERFTIKPTDVVSMALGAAHRQSLHIGGDFKYMEVGF